MIDETIRIKIEPEGTDEVTDALDALDTLESKAHQVNRSTKGFIKLAADAHKTRSAMGDAAKFTKTLPAAPVRPLNMNKLMPDYYRPPAGGKRMAGISPAALPIFASFISPAIIGAVLNRYDPFLKGAAEKYFLDPKTQAAEVAFIVQDEWQAKGMGAFLLSYLTSIAIQRGIKNFYATVLPENKAMLNIFYNCGFNVNTNFDGSSYTISYDLDEELVDPGTEI